MFVFTHWTSNRVEPATQFPSEWSQQKQNSSVETNTAHSYKKPARVGPDSAHNHRRNSVKGSKGRCQRFRTDKEGHKLGQWGRQGLPAGKEARTLFERDRPARPPTGPSKLNRSSDVAGSNESCTNGQGSNAREGVWKERRLTNGKQRRSSTPCLEVKGVVCRSLSHKLPGRVCQRSIGLYSCRIFMLRQFCRKAQLDAHSVSEIHATLSLFSHLNSCFHVCRFTACQSPLCGELAAHESSLMMLFVHECAALQILQTGANCPSQKHDADTKL